VEYEWLTPDQQAAVDEVVRQQQEAREQAEQVAGELILGLFDRGAAGRNFEVEVVLAEPEPALEAAGDEINDNDEDLLARLGVPVRNQED
jgi:hypothetical protein